MARLDLSDRELSENEKWYSSTILRVAHLCSSILFCVLLIAMSGLTPLRFNADKESEMDAKMLPVTESLLNLQNRIEKIDQENQILFRMLRNENGLLPDTSPLPVIPLPPSRPIGGALGDALPDTNNSNNNPR